MPELASEPEWKIEHTVREANQLYAWLPGHAVTHLSQIEPRVTPSYVNCRSATHPVALPSLIRKVH